MLKFTEYKLLEAVNVDNLKPKGKTEVELFLGRMQPVHKGHKAIIDKMKNPVVVLVKGKTTSTDKSKNPFDAKDQQRFLKKINSRVRVHLAGDGYVPNIVDMLRGKGLEVVGVYAGDDRMSGYERQINSFNSKVPDDKKIHVKFKKTPRITSATTVRNALKSDDLATFKKNMPKELHSEYAYMKRKLT